MKTKRFALTATTVLLASLAGCMPSNDPDLADDATGSITQAQQAAGLTKLISRPLDDQPIDSGEQAAETIESKGIPGLYPAGCAAVTLTGLNAVHVEFDDCTGPFGLLHLSGGIDAEFMLDEQGMIAIDLVDSGDLTLEGHEVSYDTHAVVESIGAEVTLSWKGHWETELEGETATHDSELTIVSEVASWCVTIDGTASSTLGERGLDWTVDGYEVCPLSCPAAGVVTATGKQSGSTVTITFDGSDKADVVVDGGQSYEVPLVCAEIL